jgi:hypothetical protein
MGATGMTPRFNFEGFVNECGGEHNFGYTQIFRNGALEATTASIIRKLLGQSLIPGVSYEKRIFEVLPNYVNGLRDIGVPPPLVVLLTLEGVKGIPYFVQDDILSDSNPAIERNILYLPDCLINEYGPEADYHRAVRPAIDALWNTAGCVSAGSFADDGTWVGKAQN